MKVGDLVYSGHMMEIGHTVLGLVGDIDRARPFDPEETIYLVFWVDGSAPVWYYSNEVERVDATR